MDFEIDISREHYEKHIDLLTAKEKQLMSIVLGIGRDPITDILLLADETGLSPNAVEDILMAAIFKLKRVED